MRIAIVGTGISGLVTAYLLDREHDLTLFEASDWAGGHSHTVDAEVAGGTYAVDTGFIVFNHWTYPNFVRLLDRLGVPSRPTTMSFGMRDDRTGLEYSTRSLRGLFAQRGNLLRPRHWGMLADFVRLGREARARLQAPDWELTLGQLLARGGYGDEFTASFIVPMGSAIWSAPSRAMLDFPAQLFVEFFHNHGMLNLVHRPVWRTVCGGSRRYVSALVSSLRADVRLRTPVRQVRRLNNHVEITSGGERGAVERFDQVVMATHSDQALALLADASDAEREVLGAICYQQNDVVLHTDDSLLPRSPHARAAWNYHLPADPARLATLTYDMNVLQSIPAPVRLCVTLNETRDINPTRVLGRYTYAHPQFDLRAAAAQRERERISGHERRTHYAGAYWFNGFHEDGVRSGLAVAQAFGARPWPVAAPVDAIRSAA